MYNTRDDKGNHIFSVDHTSKVDKMTCGQATDLLISDMQGLLSKAKRRYSFIFECRLFIQLKHILFTQ